MPVASFARHGLEGGLFDVLATLRRSSEPFRLRATEFAGALMLNASGATKRLDRLELLASLTPDEQRRLAGLLRKLSLGVAGGRG